MTVINQASAMTAVTRFTDDWTDYPRNLAGFDEAACNAEKLMRRLQEESDKLFDRQKTGVHMIDADLGRTGGKAAAVHTQLSNAVDMQSHLNLELPSLRVISIFRTNSLEKLQISRELLLKVLSRHKISQCFLDLLFAFRNVEELSDLGLSFWSPLRSSESSYELCYQFKYMEQKQSLQGTRTWSERQIGVYHRFGHHEKAVMILLHANEGTEAHLRIQQAFTSEPHIRNRLSRAFSVHLIILSSYLDNWRWWLNENGRKWRETEDRSFASDFRPGAFSFEQLQDLRDGESRLLAAGTILKTTLVTIEYLILASRTIATTSNSGGNDKESTFATGGKEMVMWEKEDTQALKALWLKCKGYHASVDVLRDRVDRLVKLLSDGLDQQSQRVTTNIADSTFKLTEQSVEDNAVVKVITIITVIYLPTSGVASFFGMNLTNFPDDGNHIQFAKDWWLFLVTAIPLTLITLAVVLCARFIEQRKKRRHQAQQRIKSLNCGCTVN